MHDFLLVAFSVVVILLSATADREERQIVEIRDASGNLKPYSLAVDDPRLAKLQDQLADWTKGRPDAALTLAKWHFELADFYVTRTQGQPSNAVVQVSFADGNQTSSAAEKEAAALRVQNAYWTRVRDQAKQTIDAVEEKRRLEKLSGSPPIVFAERTLATPSPADFGIAGLAGLVVAIVFAYWVYLCPAITLSEDWRVQEASLPGYDPDQRVQEFRIAIPAKWVRLHQPVSVLLRRVVYGFIVTGAFACLITLR